MTDPEQTDKNWRTRYAQAETVFDHLLVVVASKPLTLVLFIMWTLASVFLGMWISHP